MKPLLSIVIPTRNREYYCIKAIKNILSYKSQDFELIIQDNSDSKEIENSVTLINDIRLKYFHIFERINSTLNVDKALGHSSGEYVIMIGDDDTIHPCIFDVVNWMFENDIDILSPKFQNSLIWNQNGNSKYYIFPRKQNITQLKSSVQLNIILNNGIIGYQDFAPPRVYHGIVRRNLLDKIHNKVGKYITGLSPDIYLSFSLLQLEESYYVCDFPVSIQGICNQSTAYAGMKGTHRGLLKSAPHLFQREDYIWDYRIPKIYSVESIWAESALKSLTDFKILSDSEIESMFNKRYFSTCLILKNKSLFKSYPKLFVGCKVAFGCAIKYYIRRMYSMCKSAYWMLIRKRKTLYLKAWEDVEKWESDNFKFKE